MKHTYAKVFRLSVLVVLMITLFCLGACVEADTDQNGETSLGETYAETVIADTETNREEVPSETCQESMADAEDHTQKDAFEETDLEETVAESQAASEEATEDAADDTEEETVEETAEETAEETHEEIPEETTEATMEETMEETEAETVNETTAETAVDELVIPADAPKKNDFITFCDFSLNEDIFGGKAHTAEIVKDTDRTSVLKLSTKGKNLRTCYFTLDYAAYVEALGMSPLAWNDCAYAVITLKVENVTNAQFEIIVKGKQWDTAFQIKGMGTYQTNEAGWQKIAVPLPLTPKNHATLSEIRISFVTNAASEGETVYVKSIGFTSDKLRMMELAGIELVKPTQTIIRVPGLKNNYTFLHVTDLHASAFSGEDTSAMTAERINLITVRRNAFRADGLFAEERMPYMFSYADEINADLVLMTGDILDFPSKKNLSLLKESISNARTPTLFALGNHDWCYGDGDYFSANAIQNQIPLFNNISTGEPANDPYFRYVEYEDLLVVAIDNSMDYVTADTVDKFLALYQKNKPIILMLHVPFHVDSLVADSTKVWGKDLGMGGDTGVCAWNSDVQRLYNAVCVAQDTPVVAVIAGHVHFNHEDVFPNGVPQYITTTAYTGDCRVIRLRRG